MAKNQYLVTALKIIGGAGLLGIAVVAPNSLSAFDAILKQIDKSKRRAVAKDLKRQGLVSYSQSSNGEFKLTLTKKGRKRYNTDRYNDIVIHAPQIWDKKWRIVMFDIPERHKTGRDALTRKVKELGFLQLQKSVWIYPYPCKVEINELAQIYEIDKYVLVIETHNTDIGGKVRSHFETLLS